jgi:hypothetical protein
MQTSPRTPVLDERRSISSDASRFLENRTVHAVGAKKLGSLPDFGITLLVTNPEAADTLRIGLRNRTPTVQEFEEHSKKVHTVSAKFDIESVDYESVAEIENRSRLALLARQYVQGSMSTEEEARLMIVTERVRRLMPRFTAGDFEVLESIYHQVAAIGQATNELRDKLNQGD